MAAPTNSAKEPVSILAGPYGHPLHPLLVAVPIGAWVASIVFDVASYVADDGSTFVEASGWLIGLGVVGALAAAMVGFLDLFAIPSGVRAHRIALVHMTINLVVTALYALGFALRRADDTSPDGVPAGLFVLSLVALALLSVSGYLGGELAYRYGVRVADQTTQARGFVVPTRGGAREEQPSRADVDGTTDPERRPR